MAETSQKSSSLSVRLLAKSVTLAVVVMLVAEALRIFVGMNFGCVVPGLCYRSSQPSPAFLAEMKWGHGIRSVINLRDENPDDAWYRAEKLAAQELGIQLVDAGLWSKVPPRPDELRNVVRLIAAAPEPMLIHCASGSDRTGFASAIYMLVRTDTPLEEARQQLHLRYGHFAWTATGCLDDTLDNYGKWLSKKGWQHDRERFLDWVEHVGPGAG
jgi:protein tyrosine/serine phosphatase